MYDLSLFYTKKYDPSHTSPSFSTAVGHLPPVHGSKSISGSEISPFLIQGNLNLSRMESFSPRHQDQLTFLINSIFFSYFSEWTLTFYSVLVTTYNFVSIKQFIFLKNCQNLSYTNTPF